MSDIRLNEQAVVVDGNLGIGTEAPQRPLHTESGEIHSGGGGGGLSFGDRSTPGFVTVPAAGQRWVWYAETGAARLWSGADALSVRRVSPSTFEVGVTGNVKAKGVVADSANVTTLVGKHWTTDDVTAGTVQADNVQTASVDATSANVDIVNADVVNVKRLVGTVITFDGSVEAGNLRAKDVTSQFVTAANARVEGTLQLREVQPQLIVNGTLLGTRAAIMRGVPEETGNGVESVVCSAHALSLTDPAAPTRTTDPEEELVGDRGALTRATETGVVVPPPPPPPPSRPVPPRLALFHEFGDDIDRLVVNRLRRYRDGVRVDGDLDVLGAVTQASSLALKDDVQALSPLAAMEALRDLDAVTYRYKHDDDGARHVGFIAEDVPELVARPGRDRLSPMDIVAVLTTVVKEQQRALGELTDELRSLRPEGRR